MKVSQLSTSLLRQLWVLVRERFYGQQSQKTGEGLEEMTEKGQRNTESTLRAKLDIFLHYASMFKILKNTHNSDEYILFVEKD